MDDNERRKKLPHGKRSPAPDQQRLPFDVEYRERFALLDAIDCNRTDFGKRLWQNIRALLKTVHAVDTSGRGCFLYATEVMDRSELEEGQFYRAVKAAETAGILKIERSSKGPGRGRDTNTMWVVWPEVAKLQRRKKRTRPTSNLPKRNDHKEEFRREYRERLYCY